MSVTANLTTNVETITATIVVEDETIIAQVNTAARGPAGSAVIDAATQSDGTADLDLLNVETVTATVTDTLTAPHIHGNLAGSVYAHIRAGEALEKGDPVYVSGSFGSGSSLIAEVSKADASNAAKMPAIGIMDEDVANNATGHMVITGTITELDTAGLTVNAELYVAAGGGMTATPPTARAQPVARVERVNANNGAVIVKVNGLSASDATGNTLVRRTSGGGASFGPLSALAGSGNQHSITSSAGTNIVGPLALSGSTGDTLTATYNAAITLNSTTGVNVNGGPLALTQTWNDAAVTYTGLQVNVTDTASNAASLLMDLRVGGASRFSVRKSGFITATAGGQIGSFNISTQIRQENSFIILNNGGLFMRDTNVLRWSATANAEGGTYDLYLQRDAANTLAQRNGNAQQESRIYGTYSGAGADYRRLALKMSTAGVAQIVAEGAGSGAADNRLEFVTGGATRMTVAADGNINISATTNAASSSSGALVVGGGIGCGSTLWAGGSVRSNADFIAGGMCQVAAGETFRFAGRSRFYSSSDGEVQIRNAANSANSNLTVKDLTATGTIQTGGYTFANLPSPATQGMRAYITDGAASPVYMANAAGGGSTVTPVFYNGTNWINA